MGFGWQEIDKTLDLGYIRIAGLHRECKAALFFNLPNSCPARFVLHICVLALQMLHVNSWHQSYLRLHMSTYIHTSHVHVVISLDTTLDMCLGKVASWRSLQSIVVRQQEVFMCMGIKTHAHRTPCMYIHTCKHP